MLIKKIEGATRVVGESQGLPIKDSAVVCTVDGDNTPMMTTAWKPTPSELAMLNAGASVYVNIVGNRPPPMSVEVRPAPIDAETLQGDWKDVLKALEHKKD